MRVIVTGASGFLGTHVVRTILARGDTVLATSKASELRLGAESPASQLSHIRFDIADHDVLRGHAAAFSPDVIIHAASLGVLRWKPATTYDALRMNVLAGAEVGRTAAHLRCPVVWVGTSSEYSPSLSPVAEDAPTDPPLPYALAKHLAWRAFRQGAGDAVAHMTVRPFQLYGPRDYPERFPMAVMLALAGKGPNRFGNSTVVRDFVYVDDAVTAIVTAACHLVEGKAQYKEVLNLCTGVGTSLGDFASLAAREFGLPADTCKFAGAGAHPDVLVGNPERAVDVLQWRATTPLARGIRRMRDKLHEGL